MANKRIRTSPRYLELVGVVGGTSYTITGDGIVVPDSVAAALTGIADAAGVTTVVGDTTAPTSPVTAYPGTTRDTGWRDITHDLMDDADPGFILARRKGDHVTLMIDPYNQGGVMPGALAGNQVSAGFRPSLAVTSNSRGGSSFGINVGDDGGFGELGDGGSVLALDGDGIFQTAGMKHPNYVGMGRFDYPTDEPWPDTLPGDEVTPPSVIDDHNNTAVGIADTGWRRLEVTPDGDSGTDTTSLVCLVRRVGNVIDYVMPYNEAGPGSYVPIYPSTGFSPDQGEIVMTHHQDDRSPFDRFLDAGGDQGAGGNFTVIEKAGADVLVGVNLGAGYGGCRGTFTTSDPWPAELPGTEVTPAAVVPVQPVNLPETRDTGTRLVGATAGNFAYFVRRIGNLVSFWTPDAAIYVAPDDQVSYPNMIPVGFRPPSLLYGGFGYPQGRDSRVQFAIDGDVDIINNEPKDQDTELVDASLGMTTWPTDDPWPTVLPGDPFPS